MSSSPATTGKYLRPGKPIGRLIPGAALLPHEIRRKKPQSVAVRYWNGNEVVHPQEFPRDNGLQSLAKAVLPTPTATRDRLIGLVCFDFLCISLTLPAVQSVFVRAALPFSGRAIVSPSSIGFVFLQAVLLTLLAYTEGLYRAELTWSPPEQKVVLGKVVGLGTILLGVGLYLLNPKLVQLTLLIATAPLNYAAMLTGREVQRRTAIRNCARSTRNVLIVGSGTLAYELASALDNNPRYGRSVRGFLAEKGPIGSDVRGTINDLAAVARAEFVDEIIVLDSVDPFLARAAIREAKRNHLDIKVVPALFGSRRNDMALAELGDVPVLTLHEEPIPAGRLLLKRMMDFVGGATALILASPVLWTIALMIKLDSPGPVFYVAPRIGRKGRRFRCYKFRTMVNGANTMKDDLRQRNQRAGPFFKIAEDPRVTRLGRILRRYSLDELPQLWNVLLGDMSLVGPRPHPVDDYAQYDLDHRRRLDVTPGITGLWQVTARRDPSFERNMALDLEYIEKWSLWLDLRILWQTFSVVLRGTGV
ncbi:MAG TPA: sugar transferase [Terriglobales bacterium]